MEHFIQGLIVCFGLIVSIGVQNTLPFLQWGVFEQL